jgi:hypothetical protein
MDEIIAFLQSTDPLAALFVCGAAITVLAGIAALVDYVTK